MQVHSFSLVYSPLTIVFRMHIKLHLFPMRRVCSSIYHLRPPPLYLPIQMRILRNDSLGLLAFVLGEVVVYG